MIVVKQSGNFKHLESFLKKAKHTNIVHVLAKYAQEGVNVLAASTPYDSGLTANSWGYEIVASRSSYHIYWTNSNIQNGVPIAILLQYGHGTGTGGYVQGRDYINPAMRPIFDKIANEAWKEVSKL